MVTGGDRRVSRSSSRRPASRRMPIAPEVARRDRLVAQFALVVGRRAPFDRGVAGPGEAAQRERADGADGLDRRAARAGAARFRRTRDSASRCRVARGRQRHRERDDVLLVEARIDVLQAHEAAHQQHRADDEHDRQRDLAGDEEACAVDRGVAPATTRCGRSAARCRDAVSAGNDAEDERRDQRQSDREEQHRAIGLHVGEQRHASGAALGAARSCASAARPKPSAPPSSREQQRFGQQLPDEPPASGAERPADRHLARPADAAAELQVGDVRADDQEQEADCAAQHQQRRPRIARVGSRAAARAARPSACWCRDTAARAAARSRSCPRARCSSDTPGRSRATTSEPVRTPRAGEDTSARSRAASTAGRRGRETKNAARHHADDVVGAAAQRDRACRRWPDRRRRAICHRP